MMMKIPGKKRHRVLTGVTPEELEKAMNSFEQELEDKGWESFASSVGVAAGPSYLHHTGHVLYSIPFEQVKLCPACGGKIPEGATRHLACGWKEDEVTKPEPMNEETTEDES